MKIITKPPATLMLKWSCQEGGELTSHVRVKKPHHPLFSAYIVITLFISITVFWGTNNISRNISYVFHIQSKYEEYSLEYCQPRRTLLWIWITLWLNDVIKVPKLNLHAFFLNTRWQQDFSFSRSNSMCIVTLDVTRLPGPFKLW